MGRLVPPSPLLRGPLYTSRGMQEKTKFTLRKQSAILLAFSQCLNVQPLMPTMEK